ncbi:Met32 protein [Saccharomycopsis crataegensis]|uniref:Met32 protein n=1 Tax=Saccharomycopsis crataegensis TaxID=43959 RepID=A0AAV5QGI5_9ASCO|nr:Met32 protein [Saccharomycopsis crataegensis]
MEASEQITGYQHNSTPRPPNQQRRSNIIIDDHDQQKILSALQTVFADIESVHHHPEDSKFLEKAAEAVLLDYWDRFDQYKGRVFRKNLQNVFRNSDQNDTGAKMKYYRKCLDEVVNHSNNHYQPPLRSSALSSTSSSSIGTSSSHQAAASTSTATRNHSVFNNSGLNNSSYGFGSGDLVYSQENSTKRLKIDNILAFPKVETDLFPNHSYSSASQGLLQMAGLSSNEPNSKAGQSYSSDIYEFVSALNHLKTGELSYPQATAANGNYQGNGKAPIQDYTPSSPSSYKMSAYVDNRNTSSTTSSQLTSSVSSYDNHTSKSLGNVDENTSCNDPVEKVFKCGSCPLSFKRNSDLKRHVKTHSATLPHICNNCGKSFARKDALKRHYGTQTCHRNRDNRTYIDNLKLLTEEERSMDMTVNSRQKNPG